MVRAKPDPHTLTKTGAEMMPSLTLEERQAMIVAKPAVRLLVVSHGIQQHLTHVEMIELLDMLGVLR